MTKQLSNFLSKQEVQFWISIIVFIVGLTAWGIRLETRLDYISGSLAKHETDSKLITDSINSLWGNVFTINSKLGLNTMK